MIKKYYNNYISIVKRVKIHLYFIVGFVSSEVAIMRKIRYVKFKRNI